MLPNVKKKPAIFDIISVEFESRESIAYVKHRPTSFIMSKIRIYTILLKVKNMRKILKRGTQRYEK